MQGDRREEHAPTGRATTSGLNGRAALGISLLPGTAPKTVRQASIGQSRSVQPYRIARPFSSR
ncbi:hypothetical protein ACIRRH_33950 [Kitasatospora sp. NPDC101235]|uniref:hypothetical protein n=1 Tax=Kitasatospora sp. NPDC101235 TaxID=3364101 RepID=UPI003810A44F